MNRKLLPQGAMLGCIIGLALPIVVFFIGMILDSEQVMQSGLSMPLFSLMFGLASIGEGLFSLVGILYLLPILLPYTIAGGLIGYWIQHTKNKAVRMILIFLSLSVVGAIVFFAASIGVKESGRRMTKEEVYRTATDPSECESPELQGIENFSVNACYNNIALRSEDVSICDNMIPYKGADHQKWHCYEEVARKKLDPSICLLIPEVVLNEHKVDSGIRQGCLRVLKEWGY
ncbi:MAG: hypothetical protein HOG89_00355 [Candidatus Peribacter sp.]|jgi:hypothetical protein|nr:hypothetical protein [Candidatus Peribacter sp.]MBT4393021.1 hypothetical protein [Candidatus Peribacter sp.]MBT4601081.1 hypothetical protein [Candidatus Peribacter sp.]MBT5149557.1 hypothetical protein [Candidatus Peribacter sp.]MBT5637431.1 hypothetical protein [Candidatus Peribacter sp.]